MTMMDYKSTLIHDVRNPLNTISMNAELGKLALQTRGDIDKAIQVFDTILRECKVCGDKLSDLKETMANEGPKENE